LPELLFLLLVLLLQQLQLLVINYLRLRPWTVKEGLASWYGYGDNSGKWTASGRPFKPETFGLANKELPFGTLVKITNLENGRSVYAVVLDRGPFVKGREFDLYPKTMRALGGIKKGVIPVRVKVIRCGWPVE
jgi:rare lipoprotein A